MEHPFLRLLVQEAPAAAFEAPLRDLVRLALGTGLGGLVAQTRNPYATPNYLADERFAHTGTIDSAVSGEGLVAILGVPLMLGDDVIGVLFAADRHERPFSSEEIALLQSLAAHAAVAIENARLFEEAQQALRDLNEAAEVIRAHVGAVERAAAAHTRLTNLVLQGGSITDVAAAVTELFGGRLVVLDPEGRVIAGAGGPSAEPADDAVATTLARHERRRGPHACRPPGQGRERRHGSRRSSLDWNGLPLVS